jgi:hypothetical protein
VGLDSLILGRSVPEEAVTGALLWKTNFEEADLSGAVFLDIDSGPWEATGRGLLHLSGARWTAATLWPADLRTLMHARSLNVDHGIWVVSQTAGHRLVVESAQR